ncbi:YjcZ family sporulation protein [Alkalihalobacillus sp. BA299]|uniref:YjcZ family sporulation protein n=1 Tax=Alkalihalobacillus sp. BA299 TaxID=2815938 RepID=UPI001AD9A1DB|nr:YjcZ family sporulation protein [Alkalihalobacillus sp. BA299]
MFGYGCEAYPVSPVLPGCGGTAPNFGYGPSYISPTGYKPGYGGGFTLIVVLFILLIIIGTSWGHKGVCK